MPTRVIEIDIIRGRKFNEIGKFVASTPDEKNPGHASDFNHNKIVMCLSYLTLEVDCGLFVNL